MFATSVLKFIFAEVFYIYLLISILVRSLATYITITAPGYFISAFNCSVSTKTNSNKNMSKKECFFFFE